MGNHLARPNLTQHSVAYWQWDAAFDPIRITGKEVKEENKNLFLLHVVIPFAHGVCREDVRVRFHNGVLSIYGRRPVDKDITSRTLKDLFARYPNYTSFERNLHLPQFLDPTTIEPRWVHDGLLEIRIQRFKEEKMTEGEIEVVEMPTLADPRYVTPMLQHTEAHVCVSCYDHHLHVVEDGLDVKEPKGAPKHPSCVCCICFFKSPKKRPAEEDIEPTASKAAKPVPKEEKPFQPEGTKKEKKEESTGGGGKETEKETEKDKEKGKGKPKAKKGKKKAPAKGKKAK